MAIKPTESYTQTKQEFLNSVLNKIGKQEFSNTKYKNPLARLKGEFIEGPSDIEEIYVDRSSDTGYDKEGTGVLDRQKPSVLVQYHTFTQEHGYKCTIQNKQMRKGFLNKAALGTMADNIIQQLHTGQEVDDYQDCLNTLKALVDSSINGITLHDEIDDITGDKKRKQSKTRFNKAMNNVISVKPVTDETTGKMFVKEIKKAIYKMSDYTDMYSTKPNTAQPGDLILFLDSDTDVELSVELLASAFNMTVSELNQTSKIIIPNMKNKIGCIGLLAHNKCIKINPTYYDMDSIKNTRGKFVNYDLVTETLLSYTTWYPHVIIKDDKI